MMFLQAIGVIILLAAFFVVGLGIAGIIKAIIRWVCHSRSVGCPWCKYGLSYANGEMDCEQGGWAEPVPSVRACLGFKRREE